MAKESAQKLQYLYGKFISKSLTEEELDSFMAAISDPANETVFKELMGSSFARSGPQPDLFSSDERERMLSAILGTHQANHLLPEPAYPYPKRWNSTRYAAAAAVVLLLSVGLYFTIYHSKINKNTSYNLVNYAKPGSNKAQLTLANGSKIILTDAKNGQLAMQGSAAIYKLANGALAYKNNGANTDSLLYNTMSTPRGGQFKLQLPDGTVVTLNSESAITYPTAFNGTNRTVKLTGEAYFEVAKNKKKPFLVLFGNQTVRVLGTHFNISAYPDQAVFRTTLIEGSVSLSKAGQNVLIKPGQQASSAINDVAFSVKDADVEDVLAWTRGYFHFDDTGLDEVMQQICRWYNMQVLYDGPKPILNFTGEANRSSDLSNVLKILESTGGVKFTIDKNKIIVKKSN